jgi:hypothetical protein
MNRPTRSFVPVGLASTWGRAAAALIPLAQPETVDESETYARRGSLTLPRTDLDYS